MKTAFITFIAAFLFFTNKDEEVPAENGSIPKSVWAVEFSSDDAYLALGGDDSTLYIYNTKDYSLHKKYKLNTAIKNLTWHPSEKIIALGTLKNVQLFDFSKGISHIIPGIPGARGIAWNNSGTLLGAADGHGVVHIIDKKGKLLRSVPNEDKEGYLTMHWSADNIIAAGSDEITLFDTSGRQLAFIDHRKEYKTGVLTVRWHPSGEFFVSGDNGHEGEGIPTNLQFHKKDGNVIKAINGHHSEIRNARWNNDGSLLATASDSLRIYNRAGKLLATGKTPGKYALWSVAWSNDGKTIVTSSFESNHLDLWTFEGKFTRRVF